MNGRYEAAVATFIGVLALVVSAYTAYVQRQQVRAQVIPILQFGTSNTPQLMVGVDNKGVGPAIIKHVAVSVDGQPMRRWTEVLSKLMGPGKHPFVENDIGSLILAPNETVIALKVNDDAGAPLRGSGTPGSPTALFNEGRLHIGVEICYCSTLGDCWMLKADGRGRESRDDVRRCPAPSERTFLE
ncbi:MAG TPA: hypothetical protein VN947_34060 [Polyangia bacterium]|nr:hypothetical protein [Polyangia bacterium]